MTDQPQSVKSTRYLLSDVATDARSFANLCSDSGTDPNPLPLLTHIQKELSARFGRILREQKALVFELVLLVVDANARLLHVMDYLASEELAEPDVWMRDDLRIAWLTCLFAGRDYPEAHVAATYRVLGIHPERVYGAILARRRALLGSLADDPEFAAASNRNKRAVVLGEPGPAGANSGAAEAGSLQKLAVPVSPTSPGTACGKTEHLPWCLAASAPLPPKKSPQPVPSVLPTKKSPSPVRGNKSEEKIA